MNILDYVKSQKLTARKNKDSVLVGTYSFIQGELERKGTTLENDVALKELNKVLAKMQESNDFTGVLVVTKLLEDFTPVQLTDHEIRLTINQMKKDGPVTLPQVMKYFKETHAGHYDGKTLKTIVDEELK